MPTLCFSDDFTTAQRITLTKTFKQNCSDLGIADYDATVQVRRVSLPEHCEGAVRRLPDCYMIILNTAKSIRDWAFTLGHELVHVRQYRTGQLRDDDETGDTYWENTLVPSLYCNSQQYYHLLPWEIEAHDIQENLFERAMKALDPRSRT